MLRKVKIFHNWIRGYNFDDPARNGEYHFLRSYVTDGMVVFDVGANVGEFSGYVVSLATDLQVHCFEPVALTFDRLQQRFAQNPKGSRMVLNQQGLSNLPGKAKIKIYGDYAGSNSLYERRSVLSVHPSFAIFQEEDIDLTTLDAYLGANNINHIDLLKIDVEGHEFKVLQGTMETLATGRIQCIQFEYGGCFLDSKTCLEQIYKLLRYHGYELFRLWPYGKLHVRSFRADLENYQYSNWLAIRS